MRTLVLPAGERARFEVLDENSHMIVQAIGAQR
jgi:hypothetical protein